VDTKVKDEVKELIKDYFREQEDPNKKEDVITIRLDLKSRICTMSSFIYGTFGEISIEDAVEKAVEIENAADARVKQMKRDNPIPRQSNRKAAGK
jgi:hypothetical protein